MDEVLKSLIFEQYNRARQSKRVESGRVERALGLVESPIFTEKVKEYQTTTTDCGCPDRIVRGGYCKHMIAMIMLQRVYERVQLLWLGEAEHPLW